MKYSASRALLIEEIIDRVAIEYAHRVDKEVYRRLTEWNN